MIEALSSSETSALTRAIRSNVPEEGILHSHRLENLKSCVAQKFCAQMKDCPIHWWCTSLAVEDALGSIQWTPLGVRQNECRMLEPASCSIAVKWDEGTRIKKDERKAGISVLEDVRGEGGTKGLAVRMGSHSGNSRFRYVSSRGPDTGEVTAELTIPLRLIAWPRHRWIPPSCEPML
jgi:hypothetical protein